MINTKPKPIAKTLKLLPNDSVMNIKAVLLLGCLVLCQGCAAPTKSNDPNRDPLESTNRGIYGFNDGLDRHIMQPLAEFYVTITPDFLRTGVTNFFDNLGYLNVIANDILQGKIEQGFSDLGRFGVNTTLGIGGLFDVATEMGIPKHDEDLGQTFAVWGAGEGAYLVLPLLGPNSVRDAPDVYTRTQLNPLLWIEASIFFPAAFIDIVNNRANLLQASKIRDESALDPYAFTREAYRQQRESKIYDGNPPVESLLDELDELLDE